VSADRIREIRRRSLELWAIAALPKGSINPETGHENPWVLPSKADEEVKFLLTQIDRLQDDVARLEEVIDRVSAPAWKEEDESE